MRQGSSRAWFANRAEAGRVLAQRLETFAGRAGSREVRRESPSGVHSGVHSGVPSDVSSKLVVLGLPRGGVPVAAEVAAHLHAPLDCWLVRKLGLPGHAEFAMGALASGGDVEVDEVLLRELGVGRAAVDEVARRERAELERRERLYRRGRPPPEIAGRVVIVVDDGMATGATMRAVVNALRKGRPARIIVAVPVASREACLEIGELADECVCVAVPEPFRAVGMFYGDFSPTSDEEVLACLARQDRLGAPARDAGLGGPS